VRRDSAGCVSAKQFDVKEPRGESRRAGCSDSWQRRPATWSSPRPLLLHSRSARQIGGPTLALKGIDHNQRAARSGRCKRKTRSSLLRRTPCGPILAPSCQRCAIALATGGHALSESHRTTPEAFPDPIRGTAAAMSTVFEILIPNGKPATGQAAHRNQPARGQNGAR
jgi:hypothetical protein